MTRTQNPTDHKKQGKSLLGSALRTHLVREERVFFFDGVQALFHTSASSRALSTTASRALERTSSDFLPF